ncbi:hypothetical protein SRHO_G00061620 [Serrasalmus rhombeus]
MCRAVGLQDQGCTEPHPQAVFTLRLKSTRFNHWVSSMEPATLRIYTQMKLALLICLKVHIDQVRNSTAKKVRWMDNKRKNRDVSAGEVNTMRAVVGVSLPEVWKRARW